MKSGAVVATIYQRPHTQGRMAFRVLHEFLVRGVCPSLQVTLTPHLITGGSLDFFLQRVPWESTSKEELSQVISNDLEAYAIE
jgi:LacI family transcriptional regulator